MWKMASWLNEKCLRWSLRNRIVYPSCWEDPRVDRAALRISSDDTVLVITSGGCNALAYALDAPRHVFAVDLNFRQNALLELKLAGLLGMEFDDFFDFFGHGYSPAAKKIYHSRMRGLLSGPARRYWDRRIRDFACRSRSFYYRGGIGAGAWLFKLYVDYVARLRPALNRLFAAASLEEQVAIYRDELRGQFWSWIVRRALNHRGALALAGIPTAQIRHASQSAPDIAEHLDRCAMDVLGRVPLSDNYFWQLYVHGAYTRTCCPDYLRRESFDRLKAGLARRVTVHTATVTEFLQKQSVEISRFALLDHLDWFYGKEAAALTNEWQAIADCAAPQSRLVWRSMGAETEFIHACAICHQARLRRVGDLLAYDRDLADALRKKERVNTYSSLLIAEWRGG